MPFFQVLLVQGNIKLLETGVTLNLHTFLVLQGDCSKRETGRDNRGIQRNANPEIKSGIVCYFFYLTRVY